MEKKQTKPNPLGSMTSNAAMTNCTVFILLLVTGAVLSLVLPKESVSESEKRRLTPFPAFSVGSYFAGELTDSLDLYYSDNFPFREPFVDMSRMLSEYFGYRGGDIKLYTTQGEFPEDNFVEPQPVRDSLVVAVVDSVKATAPPEDSVSSKPANTGSILIHQGRAFQLFYGSSEAAEAYAGMINAYHEALGDSIRVFCLVAPTPIDFYLPLENKTSKNLEKPNIDMIRAHLDSGVINVDAYGEIKKHTDEYLYFNTDHHWTGRGAYYAYRAFCTAAGLVPHELDQFTRKIRKRYLGSLYDMTKDLSLRNNRDSVETFRLHSTPRVVRYATAALDSPVVSRMFAETVNYTTFLGGDFPLIRIDTDVENERRVLIIKDSYGNAMAPFLALHYQQVFVADYRYFEKNLVNFINNKKITDVIFLHNTFVVNTKYTVKRELYLMRKRERIILPDTSKIKTQPAEGKTEDESKQ